MPKTETDIKIERGQVSPEQMKEILSGAFVSVKQIADRLNYSSAWINGLCQQGRIKGIKPFGGRWRIPKSEYERIIREGIPPLPKEEEKPPVTEIEVKNPSKVEEPKRKPDEHGPTKEPGIFPFFRDN